MTTEAPQALPRPVSSEEALRQADRLQQYWSTTTADMLRALVSERDALAVRVRELEAFAKEYVEAWEAGMAGDSYLLRLARAALTTPESKP